MAFFRRSWSSASRFLFKVLSSFFECLECPLGPDFPDFECGAIFVLPVVARGKEKLVAVAVAHSEFQKISRSTGLLDRDMTVCGAT